MGISGMRVVDIGVWGRVVAVDAPGTAKTLGILKNIDMTQLVLGLRIR